MEISSDCALGFRTTRQKLHVKQSGQWIRVVSELLGVQSQVMSAGQMQIAVRATGVSRAAIERALWKQHRVFKTNFPRGTVHLQAAEVLSLLVCAHSDEGPQRWEQRLVVFGMKPDHARAVTPAVVEALGEGPLTRRELAKKVSARIAPELEEPLLSGWSWALRGALGAGLVCFGPKVKQETTFMLTQGLLAPSAMDPEDAKREVVRRYFSVYGPAGVDEFSLWLGVVPKLGRQWVKLLDDELTKVTVEGRKQFILTKDVDELKASSARGTLRLLPFFDVYLLARTDKDLLVDRALRAHVYRPAAWVAPTVIVDGRIAGTWKHALKAKACVVEVELFGPPSKRQTRVLAQQAEEIGSFLGAEQVQFTVNQKRGGE